MVSARHFIKRYRLSVNKITGPYCLVYILCLIHLCFRIIELAKTKRFVVLFKSRCPAQTGREFTSGIR